MKKNIFNIVLILLVMTHLQAKFPPNIKWKEIYETPFVMVFPEGYEPSALETLKTAQCVYDQLQQLWNIPIKGKIRILLTDSTDESNGNATVFPFNRIEIALFHPLPDTENGGTHDWLRQVLTHEMTHLLIMNAGSGFSRFMRKITGSNPVFYPMMFSPNWLLEGTAIYAESELCRGGRLNTPYYSNQLTQTAGDHRLPPLTGIYGTHTPWPGPSTPYIYGSMLFKSLANTYGKEKISQLIHQYSRWQVPLFSLGNNRQEPFTVSRPFTQVFGKPLGTLWLEACNTIPAPDPSLNSNRKPEAVEILTHCGFDTRYPTVDGETAIYYVHTNFREYPGIYRLDMKTRKSRRILKMSHINGMSLDTQNRKLFFSAVDYYKVNYRCSDIYALDLTTRHLEKLSSGCRLYHPVLYGNLLYCVQRNQSRSYLAVIDLTLSSPSNPQIRILSSGYEGMATPEVSPDGQRVAVSLKEENQPSIIAIFSKSGELLQRIQMGKSTLYNPSWKDNNDLYFIYDDHRSYRPAVIHLDNGEISLNPVSETNSIRHMRLIPGKKEAIITRFGSNGFDLGRIPLNESPEWCLNGGFTEESTSSGDRKYDHTDGVIKKNPLVTLSDPEGVIKSRRSYRFWRELVPKYFSPYARSAGNEIQPGIYFSGEDLLQQHNYQFESYYGGITQTFNWSLSYTYEGFYPSITFLYKDFTDLRDGGGSVEYTSRQRKFATVMLYPLIITSNHQAWSYSELYFEKLNEKQFPQGPAAGVDLNGIKAGFLYNSAHHYYDGFSFADGIRVAVSYAADWKALGSHYTIHTAALDSRCYLSVFRPNVLALRLMIADSWGKTRRRFFMGGDDPGANYQIAGDSLFELMRGYPSGFFNGTGGYLFNIEYRMNLSKVERALMSAVNLDRLYLTFFSDIGNMWLERKTIHPAFSFGAEFNLIATIGDIPFHFTGGIGTGTHPNHDPVYYFRIGKSF